MAYFLQAYEQCDGEKKPKSSVERYLEDLCAN